MALSPSRGSVYRRLAGALWSGALAGLLLASSTGVAWASGTGDRVEQPTAATGARVAHVGTVSLPAALQAAYRAARAERSFEIVYEVPLPLFGSGSPSKPLYWVLQTKQSSRAVERYQFTLDGKLVTDFSLFSAQRTCTWFAAGQAPPNAPKSATVPSCSGFSSSGYDAELFPFLSLTGAHLSGPGRIAGTAVTGVAGNLDQVIHNNGASTSWDWGPVTFWTSTTTSLPVAATVWHDGRNVVLFEYLDWDSPAVIFPPGTPS